MLAGIAFSLLTVAAFSTIAPHITGITSVSASAVRAIENWVNGTSANATVRANQNWATAAGIIGLVVGLADTPVALGMLGGELFPADGLEGNPLTAVVALALSVVVLVVTLYLITHPSVPTEVFALVLALLAATANAYAFLNSKIVQGTPSMRMLGLINLVLGATGAALTGEVLLIVII